MKPDILRGDLASMRARISKLEDEENYYASAGNEPLARRMRDERRQCEIECGHIANELKAAAQ